MKLKFSRQIFRKILKYQISWKFVQRDASCSMRTDWRTDMKKLIVAFRNFANAPKNDRVTAYNMMNWAHGTRGTESSCINFGGKTWRNETAWTTEAQMTRQHWTGSWRNKNGCNGLWFKIGRDLWWPLVNTIMNLRVPQNAGDILTSWGTISFSRRTLLHWVS